MSSLELRGHSGLVEGLLRAAGTGRLAHALLFHGPEGVGKFLAARVLAAGLLCEHGPARPCGDCGACKRVAAGSHADLFVLDAAAEGNEAIQIDRIRAGSDEEGPSVGDFLTLRAREGGWRVLLVREAQRLNDAAQNALLKMLEEPGERVLFVLETSRLDQLLSTTLSRCVRVGFGPLSAADASAVLATHGLAGEEAEEHARWAHGSPGRALRLWKQGARRQREIVAALARGELAVAAAKEELFELEGEFEGDKPTARARARARVFLDLALEVLLDAERAAAGLDPGTLAHGGLALELAAAPAAARERRLEELLAARQDVERNLAGEALVERALYALRARPSFALSRR